MIIVQIKFYNLNLNSTSYPCWSLASLVHCFKTSYWNCLQYVECSKLGEWPLGSIHLTLSLHNAANNVFPHFDIIHKFDCGATNDRMLYKNQDHASFVSPSTITNAIGNIFLFPSCAIATNKVPWYFSVRNVPSTCTIGLQFNVWLKWPEHTL